jgi:hypothetical protein
MADQRLDIAFLNSVIRELHKYGFKFEYIVPLYNENYIQFKLIRETLNNTQPTVMTIKSNGNITFSVDRNSPIPNISATQTLYTASSKFKGWTRISCGYKSIFTFFSQLGPSIALYL